MAEDIKIDMDFSKIRKALKKVEEKTRELDEALIELEETKATFLIDAIQSDSTAVE